MAESIHRKRYDAFISYSSKADAALATAIERALKQLAKPWYQRRALEVFRDDAAMTVSSGVWSDLAALLDRSEWMVLLASPTATKSDWVGKEIDHWVATHGAERILVAVTDGTWTWDRASNDFAWSRPEDVTAVHPALRGVFSEEPRHLDLRWAHDSPPTLRDPRFRHAVAQIVARIRGVETDEIVGEDIRQQKRVRRIATGAIAALATLAIVASAAGAVAISSQRRAERERDRAEVEAQRALSQSLAGRALSADRDAPDVRLLRAVAAERIEQTPASQGALLRTLLDLAEVEVLLGGHTGSVADLSMSADGATVVTADGAGQVRIWGTDGKLLGGPVELEAVNAHISADGEIAVAIDRDGTATWLSSDGSVRASIELDAEVTPSRACDAWGCGRPLTALSPDGATLAMGIDAEDASALRFVGPDLDATDIAELDDRLTGIHWSTAGALFVGDSVGIKTWDLDGPLQANYGYLWDGAAGMLPGGFSTEGGDAEGNGTTIAMIRPSNDVAENFVEWVRSNSSDGRWSVFGAATTDALGSLAISAGETSGGQHRAVLGSDPQLAGGTVPRVSTLSSSGDGTESAYWGAPAGAVTRIAAAPDADGSPIAIAGLDSVVRIIGSGSGNGVVSLEADIAAGLAGDMGIDAVPFRAWPEELSTDLLPDVDGQVLVRAAVDRERGRVAGVYVPADVPISVRVTEQVSVGTVRIVDRSGRDITPESLTTAEATAVSFDEVSGELWVGTREGTIGYHDVSTGDVLQRVQVSESPITQLGFAPDGNLAVVSTTEELLLVDGADARTVAVLVARRRDDRLTSGAQYEVPKMDAVVAGFDDGGDLWFGWSKEMVDAGLGGEFSPRRGPFAEILVEELPALPGSESRTVTYAPAVRLQLGDLVDRACTVANRDLTDAEWERLSGATRRVPVCEGFADPTGTAPLLQRFASVSQEYAPVTGENLPLPSGDSLPGPTGSGPFGEGDVVPEGEEWDDPYDPALGAEAIEDYLLAEAAADGLDHNGACVSASGSPAAEPCYLVVPTMGIDTVVALDRRPDGDRLVAAQGPRPWSVIGTWDLEEPGEAPDWAQEAMSYLDAYGGSSPAPGGVFVPKD